MNGGTTLLLTLVLAISMSSATLVPDRKALASVMAVDAADYMPTAANLPAGYREVAFDVVNDELESTIAFRRAFVTLDGNGRVAVDVSLGTSEHDAHKMLNRRVSQLSPYYGWRITPMESFGEGGYRGTGSGPDGSNGAMIVFRIQAVVAEIMVGNSTGGPDILLMDNLARLVERRISSEPSAVAYQPGRPVEPVQFPGREPVVNVGAVSAPATGQPSTADLVVSVQSIQRRWSSDIFRPRAGMEFVTVDIRIDNPSGEPRTYNAANFELVTANGARYGFSLEREPWLTFGQVLPGMPVRGWITFEIPLGAQVTQLLWAPRYDQTVVIEL